MNIRLTPAELKELVRIALHIEGGELTVEIVDPSEIGLPVYQALKSALLCFPDYSRTEKISAIKKFRELCPKAPDELGRMFPCVGLAEAKWAIENPEQALSNLRTIGKLQ